MSVRGGARGVKRAFRGGRTGPGWQLTLDSGFSEPLSKRVMTSLITTRRDVRRELIEAGWSFYRGDELVYTADLAVAFQDLQSDFCELPLDPYSETQIRRRRHSRLVYLPWANALTVQPSSSYYQHPEYNPTDGGVVRHFQGLTQRTLGNAFLLDLIRLDFKLVPFPEAVRAVPVDVGLHMISYEPRSGVPAISSPNKLHKDGEPYTFVHLICRDGVEGGESVVADNDERPIAEFTLTGPLDTFVVRDSAVVHRVKEVRVAPGQTRGVRGVLLVDFTPFKRDMKV